MLVPTFSWGDEKKIEDGHHQVEVALWHAYEEKGSMGNAGLVPTAEVFVSNGEMYAYLQMKTLTVGDITTSLTRLFYADETSQIYKAADTYLFDIEIPNETEKRPRIFMIPLDSKKEYYDILVDPKVSVMGTDPIKARLKIDWDSLKKIEKDRSIHFKIQNDETKQQDRIELSIQNVIIKDPQGVSGEIAIAPLTRNNLGSNGLELDPLDQAKGYEISAKEQIKEIAFDQTTDVDKQALPILLNDGASILFKGEKEITHLYLKTEEEFSEIPFEMTDEGILVKNARYGVYAFVKKHMAAMSMPEETTKETNFPNTTRPQPRPISNITTPKTTSVPKKNTDAAEIVTTDPSASTQKEVPSSEAVKDGPDPSGSPKVIIKEHKGIIATIGLLYLILLSGGFYLWKRFLPHLLDEFDRSKYLQIYALRSGEGEK
ncbi:MAG: hypothetical protein Q4A75_01930 [Peptostreptococcaceae bacterium]|nr:hypothetical protein [Peptostreptococcaceae bacterium]